MTRRTRERKIRTSAKPGNTKETPGFPTHLDNVLSTALLPAWRNQRMQGKMYNQTFGKPPAANHPIPLPPGSQLFCISTQSHSIYNTVLPGFKASLSVQPTPLGESLVRANRSNSTMSQACYGHRMCNLKFVHLFRFSLPLSFFLSLFLSPHPRGHIATAPFAHCAVPNPRVKCGTLLSLVVPSSRRYSATQSVHYFPSPPAHVFPRSPALPTRPPSVTCGHPCRAAPPIPTVSSCTGLFRCSDIRVTGERLSRRGCNFSVTCNRAPRILSNIMWYVVRSLL